MVIERWEAAPPDPRDAERRAGLRRMKRLATALLAFSALVFAVAFALKGQYPWLAFVQAAAEGAMVGALADWFAVTALFRYPFGLRIPHTAVIPDRKDEIGESLGRFVEDNFLSEAVVRGELATFGVAGRLGTWLADPANAERVGSEGSVIVQGVLDLLDDEDMARLIERIARRYLLEREWPPILGLVGGPLLAGPWLGEFSGRFWGSLKSGLSDSLADPDSEVRQSAAGSLAKTGLRLQNDPELRSRVDAWIADAVAAVVREHRHDLASVISSTVRGWDPHETARKIELQVGRDLQFIRINGTVIGAIAGVAIFAIATGLHALL